MLAAVRPRFPRRIGHPIFGRSAIKVAAERARHLRQNGHKRHLARRLGDRFRAGIVLYAGEQQLSFGDRLTALPMAASWMLDSSAS
jgi:uncharacterized protein